MKQLIIVARGGLANRMRAIASGVSLAMETGADYRIVWPVNSELNCPFDTIFKPAQSLRTLENVSALKALWLYDDNRKRNMWLARIVQAGRYGQRFSDMKGLPESAQLGARIDASEGCSLISSGLNFYPFETKLYRQLFCVRPEIKAEALCRLDGDGDRFVGIHIRRTDNRQSIERSPLRLFVEAMEKEIEANPEVRFYLATDDEETKRDLREKFGGRIVTSTSKARRDTREGIIEAMVEMTALSLCRHIYGSFWSSFSEAAALLGSTRLTVLSV